MNKWKQLVSGDYSLRDLLCWVYIKCIALCSLFQGVFQLRMASIIQGVKVGSGVKVYGSPILIRGPRSEIRIGDGASLISNSKRCTASALFTPVRLRTYGQESRIIIGKRVGLNGTNITARSKSIIIGDNTMIAPNVLIMDSDFHAPWPPELRPVSPGFEYDKDVIIGENVWIGSQSIILKGVCIGNNTIVAAGSVVTKSIPANVMVCGVPAKVIRSLI